MAGTFQEAWVEEVIIDVNVEELAAREGDDAGIDAQTILKAPHMSLIVREFANQKQQTLAYPFFPPYLLMPVKVGDHVWVLKLGDQLYWLCRKTQISEVDDLAHTWPERASGPKPGDDDMAEQQARASEGKNIPPRVETSVGDIHTNEEDEANDEFQFFHTVIEEKRKYVPEVVPRFKKRPGDLVIQGSNNTLISLGADRGFKKEDTIDISTPTSATEANVAGSGTIDIVTGRGRYLPKKATTEAQVGDLPLRTAPSVATNSMGEDEVDKDGIQNELGDAENRSEGDPDFGFDASRIYISSNTKVDENFSLIESYPPIPAVITADAGSVPTAVEGAAITLKSDEIRIVARKHIAADYFADASNPTATADAADVNGSIKIVKEGTRDSTGHSTTDGEGAAIIALQNDGTIMIDGPTVVIGTGRETANGTGDHIFLGAGASEPIVLGNEMKTLLTDFFTALETWLKSKFDAHIHPVGSGYCGNPVGFTGEDAGTAAARDALEKTLSKIGKTK